MRRDVVVFSLDAVTRLYSADVKCQLKPEIFNNLKLKEQLKVSGM